MYGTRSISILHDKLRLYERSTNICCYSQVLKTPILWALLVTYVSLSDGLKSSKKRPENGGDISVKYFSLLFKLK